MSLSEISIGSILLLNLKYQSGITLLEGTGITNASPLTIALQNTSGTNIGQIIETSNTNKTLSLQVPVNTLVVSQTIVNGSTYVQIEYSGVKYFVTTTTESDVVTSYVLSDTTVNALTTLPATLSVPLIDTGTNTIGTVTAIVNPPDANTNGTVTYQSDNVSLSYSVNADDADASPKAVKVVYNTKNYYINVLDENTYQLVNPETWKLFYLKNLTRTEDTTPHTYDVVPISRNKTDMDNGIGERSSLTLSSLNGFSDGTNTIVGYEINHSILFNIINHNTTPLLDLPGYGPYAFESGLANLNSLLTAFSTQPTESDPTAGYGFDLLNSAYELTADSTDTFINVTDSVHGRFRPYLIRFAEAREASAIVELDQTNGTTNIDFKTSSSGVNKVSLIPQGDTLDLTTVSSTNPDEYNDIKILWPPNQTSQYKGIKDILSELEDELANDFVGSNTSVIQLLNFCFREVLSQFGANTAQKTVDIILRAYNEQIRTRYNYNNLLITAVADNVYTDYSGQLTNGPGVWFETTPKPINLQDPNNTSTFTTLGGAEEVFIFDELQNMNINSGGLAGVLAISQYGPVPEGGNTAPLESKLYYELILKDVELVQGDSQKTRFVQVIYDGVPRYIRKGYDAGTWNSWQIITDDAIGPNSNNNDTEPNSFLNYLKPDSSAQSLYRYWENIDVVSDTVPMGTKAAALQAVHTMNTQKIYDDVLKNTIDSDKQAPSYTLTNTANVENVVTISHQRTIDSTHPDPFVNYGAAEDGHALYKTIDDIYDTANSGDGGTLDIRRDFSTAYVDDAGTQLSDTLNSAYFTSTDSETLLNPYETSLENAVLNRVTQLVTLKDLYCDSAEWQQDRSNADGEVPITSTYDSVNNSLIKSSFDMLEKYYDTHASDLQGLSSSADNIIENYSSNPNQFNPSADNPDENINIDQYNNDSFISGDDAALTSLPNDFSNPESKLYGFDGDEVGTITNVVANGEQYTVTVTLSDNSTVDYIITSNGTAQSVISPPQFYDIDGTTVLDANGGFSFGSTTVKGRLEIADGVPFKIETVTTDNGDIPHIRLALSWVDRALQHLEHSSTLLTNAQKTSSIWGNEQANSSDNVGHENNKAGSQPDVSLPYQDIWSTIESLDSSNTSLADNENGTAITMQNRVDYLKSKSDQIFNNLVQIEQTINASFA